MFSMTSDLKKEYPFRDAGEDLGLEPKIVKVWTALERDTSKVALKQK